MLFIEKRLSVVKNQEEKYFDSIFFSFFVSSANFSVIFHQFPNSVHLCLFWNLTISFSLFFQPIFDNVKEKGKDKSDDADEKTNKRLSVERIYQKKSQLEHILLRPDTYIGSVEVHTTVSFHANFFLSLITYKKKHFEKMVEFSSMLLFRMSKCGIKKK